MPELSGKTAAVWLEPEQAGLVREIVGELGLRVVGVGSPALGRAAELAADLSPLGRPAAALDDLRQALVGAEGELFILASTGEFGRGSGGGAGAGGDSTGANAAADAAALAARRARTGAGGSAVVTFNPLPASALDLTLLPPAGGATEAERAGVVIGQQSAVETGAATAGWDSGGGAWAAFVPLFRGSPTMRSAADVLSHAGSIHTVAVEFLSGEGEGWLGARLLDAVDVATHALGEPDSVEATYVWPGRGRVVHPLPGDSLHGLRGAMTANLRYGDGRVASLVCADASVGAGRWSRRVTMIGEGGRARVGDSGFEFVGADGAAVDRSEGWNREAEGAAAAEVFARAIGRELDPRGSGVRDLPLDWPRVLSVAGAALLSARTGEPESPQTIRRMAPRF